MLWSHATKHYGSGTTEKTVEGPCGPVFFTFLSFDSLAVSFASG
jgi:hypothetical protein